MIKINLEEEQKKIHSAEESLIKRGYLTHEHLKKLSIADTQLATIRGTILERAIETEMMLDLFLYEYFIYNLGNLMKERGKHFDYILETLTVHEKIELFSQIKYHMKKEFNGRYDGLEKILIEINNSRNLIAHSIRAHFIEPKIIGKKGEINLNEKYQKKFNIKADYAMTAFGELTEKLVNEAINNRKKS